MTDGSPKGIEKHAPRGAARARRDGGGSPAPRRASSGSSAAGPLSGGSSTAAGLSGGSSAGAGLSGGSSAGARLSSSDDDLPELVKRVRNRVAAELDAQLYLRGERILLEDVCEVAYAVAVRLAREFRIERMLDQQEGLRDDDLLGPDGAAFYGSEMPDGDRYPIFDYRWPTNR